MGGHSIYQRLDRVHTDGSVDFQPHWPTVRDSIPKVASDTEQYNRRFTWGIEMTCISSALPNYAVLWC